MNECSGRPLGDDMEISISLASAAFALAAIGVTWRVYSHQRTQSHFALALSLHRDLTTGEVAVARDLIGTLWYGDEPIRGSISNKQALTAYFTVLWCFERIRAGDRTMRAHSRRLRRRSEQTTPPLRFMYDMVHWHVAEWATYLDQIREMISARFGKYPDDRYSTIALKELEELLEAAGYPMHSPNPQADRYRRPDPEVPQRPDIDRLDATN
jgi:hypothetical protein